MKISRMKNTIAALLVCSVLFCFSMVADAADGKIMFTDPSTKVGETLELKGVLTSSTTIEDREIVMTYDTTMLKFKEGNSVTETEPGKLTYSVKGQKDGSRVEYFMYFEVLKEGTATVSVASYKAWDTMNDAINCSVGSSKITIAAGEGTNEEPQQPTEPTVPTEGVTVDVNGVTYTFLSDYSGVTIPNGYVESVLTYQETQQKVVVNQMSGVTLAYLVDAQGVGNFFLYDLNNNAFVPYEMVDISATTSIMLLTDAQGVELPAEYMMTSLVINGKEFPAWQDAKNPGYYIVYAMNNAGEKTLYQLDSAEGTYQRFNAPEAEVPVAEDDDFIGKLANFLTGHMDLVILGAGFGFLLMFVIIIVLAVKLHNRNSELDDIYDEYGIGEDDNETKEEKGKIVEAAVDETKETEEIEVPEEPAEEEEDNEEVEVEFFEEIAEETEDDIVEIKFEEETEDEEVEVEFFEETPEEENIEDYVLKLDDSIFEEETVFPKETSEEEEEEFYDDDDFDFDVDFIDLDD